MKKTSSERSGASRHIGITWKMYAILILFVALVVGVIWFFQVQMLNYFYQSTKFQELEFSAAEISLSIGNKGELENTADSHASEYYMDIWVYHVVEENGEANLLLSAKVTGEPEIPLMGKKFSVFYDKALENGGVYIAMVPLIHFHENSELQIIADNSGEADAYPFVSNYSGKVSAVYVSVRDIGGERYMIVESTNLTPVRTIVSTLKDQSLWIGFILSMLALVMAVIMSRLITKPIVKMNEAAKRLALGQYDANFSGSGYREINELADTLNYAS